MDEVDAQSNSEKALEYIQQYKRSNQGTSPSLEEVAAGCGFSGRSHARYYILILEQQGKVKYLGTRNIQILVPEEEAV